MTQNTYTVARAVNPDAGTHAISAHPGEQAAADAATRRSWRQFPYYPKRYGERGYRFSLSDSGWIATLCDLAPQEAVNQAKWLGGLLAARGMPRYLLECHLDFLYDELSQTVPERRARYETLKRCAGALTQARVARIDEDRFQLLATDFDTRVKDYAGAVPRMGAILVAAVADDLDGVVNAVSSVEEWTCDPARFGEDWIEAVKQTLSAARS